MHEAPLPFQPNLSVGALVTIFVCGIAVAGLIALLRRTAVRSRLPFALSLTVAFLLFCFVIKGIRTVDSVTPTPHETTQRTIEIPVVQMREPESSDIASSDTTSSGVANAESSAKSSLPDWTKQTSIQDGKRKLVAINGGRFASEEEAELHAFDQATLIATQEFQHLDPQGQGRRLPIHREEIQRTAIKQRFLEVREHDFGKSKGPMYQVWLQLELTPDLGQRITTPWRQAAVDARVHTLAACGIWLTAVAGLVSFAFRWDTARQGRSRTAVFVTVLIVAAGSLLFVA